MIVQLLLDYLNKGGFVMWAIAIMSVIWLSIMLYKMIEFRYFGITRFGHITRQLHDWLADPTLVPLESLKRSRNPTARVLEVAIRGVCGNCNNEQVVREEVARVALIEIAKLQKGIGVVEIIALISPLLGLFGTVLGIIEAFQQIAETTSQVDPAALSGGIWVALLTTAAGLAVGIPATLSHSWLESKIGYLTQQMNNAVTQVFTRRFLCEYMQQNTQTTDPAKK